MTSSFCLSSIRNSSTSSPRGNFLHKTHLYIPKRRSSFFPHETPFPKRETSLLLKPQLLALKSSFLPNLRLKDAKYTHPFASLSSYAEAEGEEEQKEEIKFNENHRHEVDKTEDDDSRGMAQAFHISSRTASAIYICIAFVVLCFPLFMKSLGQGLSLKTKLLSYATLLSGFYMAWNIGANDVANAMGTSVGSGALSLRQAVLTAAVLEFTGALLMGTHVTSTMQKGILVANVFKGKDMLLFSGLLASLAAAGTWLQVQITGPLFLIGCELLCVGENSCISTKYMQYQSG